VRSCEGEAESGGEELQAGVDLVEAEIDGGGGGGAGASTGEVVRWRREVLDGGYEPTKVRWRHGRWGNRCRRRRWKGKGIACLVASREVLLPARSG
jgi:hypothetical protein